MFWKYLYLSDDHKEKLSVGGSTVKWVRGALPDVPLRRSRMSIDGNKNRWM